MIQGDIAVRESLTVNEWMLIVALYPRVEAEADTSESGKEL